MVQPDWIKTWVLTEFIVPKTRIQNKVLPELSQGHYFVFNEQWLYEYVWTLEQHYSLNKDNKTLQLLFDIAMAGDWLARSRAMMSLANINDESTRTDLKNLLIHWSTASDYSDTIPVSHYIIADEGDFLKCKQIADGILFRQFKTEYERQRLKNMELLLQGKSTGSNNSIQTVNATSELDEWFGAREPEQQISEHEQISLFDIKTEPQQKRRGISLRNRK